MRAFLLLGLLAAAAPLLGVPARFTSGPARVALIELYTSEGCSSCPPADAWLGDLRANPLLWKQVVPVQFHVNYWDSLGWKDRLSTPGFTARQYAYASAWGSPNVYTPCFVRNGAEWKPAWGLGGATGESAGTLSVEVGEDHLCRVEFRPGPAASPSGRYEVHVACLGGGISSDVKAGENRGETLTHEFVVLGIADASLTHPGKDTLQTATLALPHPGIDATRRAVAAWVTLQGQLEPLQAAGGWL